MRFHTSLGVIARRTGFPTTEMSGWQTRGDGPMADRPTGVAVHHTADSPPADMPSLRTVTYGRPGLENALCNYGLGRSGRIYVVAAGEAWHAGKVLDDRFANTNCLGIEAANSGLGERWPAVQVEAYVRLCAELCRAFDLDPAMVRGHKEICSPTGRKIDPVGIDMAGFRRAVTARLANPTNGDDVAAADVKAINTNTDIRTGVIDKNNALRTEMILKAIAADPANPLTQEMVDQAIASNNKALAAAIGVELGGSADAAAIEQALRKVLTQGTGGTP